MKVINSFGIYFNLRTDKGKDGKAPVYVCITVNGQKAFMATKHQVNIKCWDKNKGFGKSNTAEGREVNKHLESIRQSIRECYQEIQIQRKPVTAEIIKMAFSGRGENEHTLAEIAAYHIEMSTGTLAQGTMKNYYTTQKYIAEFVLAKYKRKDYFLSELNYKFIQDFEIFLRKHQPLDHQKPLTNNGIMKHLERFRKMINLAFRLEWISRDPFEKFKLKYNRVEKNFLTAQELTAIEVIQLHLPRLSVVRDIFVFSCYTGLAFVDVMNLRPVNICVGVDGGLWIKTYRQKTTIAVNVPLLNHAQCLIEKYKYDIKANAKGTIFPQLSNQKMNGYLKELAEMCEINKVLTFHIARHTFATTVTLLNGVPIETVSKLLGHTSLRSTQVYAKVIEQKVSQDMALLKIRLNK